MKIQEAYKILESPSSISEEDLKKKYKDLAKKYHPDIYKDNPNKFKQINEAYQFIKNYKENPPPQESPFDFSDVFQGFAGFRQNRTPSPRRVNHIFVDQEISFEDSILGVEKEIEIERDIKCDDCNGEGFRKKRSDCVHCGGRGSSTIKQGNITFNNICQHCRGQATKEECLKCNKKSYVTSKTKLKVKIPAGVEDKNVIQLQGAGNFSHSSIFGDAYSNTLINITVKNETKLKLDNKDVVFNLNISLLEALEGCIKTVPSIKGEQNIKIPPSSRNKEEITLKNLGVPPSGNERVILNVTYPENKEKLISALKEGN